MADRSGGQEARSERLWMQAERADDHQPLGHDLLLEEPVTRPLGAGGHGDGRTWAR